MPATIALDAEDPRLNGEYVRECPAADGGDVTLVGVVHDHPASKYRVRTVIEDRAPDALALELPPLAVPLFEQYAEDSQTPPVFGGEMSTAIQAAATDRVAGVDGPTPAFTARLLRNLYREGSSLDTVRTVLGSLGSVTKHALTCRFAAALAGRTSLRLEVDSPMEYDCAWHDDPDDQATDERAQVRQARAIMDAFEPSSASRFRDETREAHMADRLSELRREGDVVAVVGIHHLDALADRLRARA